jgi:hypothetical protein
LSRNFDLGAERACQVDADAEVSTKAGVANVGRSIAHILCLRILGVPSPSAQCSLGINLSLNPTPTYSPSYTGCERGLIFILQFRFSSITELKRAYADKPHHPHVRCSLFLIGSITRGDFSNHNIDNFDALFPQNVLLMFHLTAVRTDGISTAV